MAVLLYLAASFSLSKRLHRNASHILTSFDSTQKILHHARLAQAGQMKPDPVRESVALELDFINIL